MVQYYQSLDSDIPPIDLDVNDPYKDHLTDYHNHRTTNYNTPPPPLPPPSTTHHNHHPNHHTQYSSQYDHHHHHGGYNNVVNLDRDGIATIDVRSASPTPTKHSGLSNGGTTTNNNNNNNGGEKPLLPLHSGHLGSGGGIGSGSGSGIGGGWNEKYDYEGDSYGHGGGGGYGYAGDVYGGGGGGGGGGGYGYVSGDMGGGGSIDGNDWNDDDDVDEKQYSRFQRFRKGQQQQQSRQQRQQRSSQRQGGQRESSYSPRDDGRGLGGLRGLGGGEGDGDGDDSGDYANIQIDYDSDPQWLRELTEGVQNRPSPTTNVTGAGITGVTGAAGNQSKPKNRYGTGSLFSRWNTKRYQQQQQQQPSLSKEIEIETETETEEKHSSQPRILTSLESLTDPNPSPSPSPFSPTFSTTPSHHLKDPTTTKNPNNPNPNPNPNSSKKKDPLTTTTNPHSGPPPLHPMLRRNRTNKRIKLTDGNLVLDLPIPTRLGGFLPRKGGKGEEEVRMMRYTACTCDPDDYERDRFTLRPAIMNRHTEIFVGVTMYNEDEVLFTRTMHGLMKNISHLCSRERSRTWGKDGWKKVVICIVADGRKNIHPRVLDCLAAMGVYQDGVAQNVVYPEKDKKKFVNAHIFEFTTQLSIDPDLKFKGLEKGIVPTQIIFCLKEKNAKKINSHRWFFNAFCPLLQPNITILLDVGTKPGPKSLYYLWKTFDLNSNVAGACGEICAMKGKMGLGLLNPLVAAQNFEYKISNILDKPTESLFGYISVLPGAFSAYRYIALLNDDLGQGPLASYFKGEHLAGHDADVFTSNMYLAEDRILCWELVAKRGASWVLKYVKSAVGETDVPDQIPEFISQRRRWLNGSFFAAVYSLAHVFEIFRTEHSIFRKLALLIESFYNTLNLTFSWFALANYYIFFIILTTSLEYDQFKLKAIKYINPILQYLYAGTLVACFLFAMGNRPQGSKWKYSLAMAVFSSLTAYMLFAAVYLIIKSIQGLGDSGIYAQIIISVSATYGCYLFSSLLAMDPWHLVTCMGQYMLFAPIYINVLNVFAFANLHDFSWGTKDHNAHLTDLGIAISSGEKTVDITLPTAQKDIDVAYDDALHALKTRPKILPSSRSDTEKETLKQDYYRNVRTNVLLAWALSNGILAATVLHGDISTTFAKTGGNVTTRIYMIIILGFVALMSVVRFVGSTGYLLVRLFAG